MMSLRRLGSVLCLLVAFVSVSPLESAWGRTTEMTKRLQVVGTGKVYGGNVAAARDEAIAYGLWNAIEQGTQHLLSPAGVVSHFQSLSADIFSQPEVFIQDYKVLTESKVGQRYRVVVEVTVLMDTLRRKLQYMGILSSEKDLPRVLLLLSETNVGTRSPRLTWEKGDGTAPPLIVEDRLIQAMEARGFTVLKPRMVSSEEDGGSDFTRAGPTDEAALRWGRQIGADVVVLGNAVAQGTGNVSGTGTHAVEARVSLRALRVDTAESIGSFQAANAAVHRNEETAGMDALELATSDIAEELSRQIAAGWRGESSHTRLVKLFVTGIEKYADFVQLRRTLKNEITGTKNVYLRGIRTEEAQVDVEVQGTARMLAEELVLKNFNDFGINVVEVGQNTIRLSLIPKGNDTPVTETPQESIETEPLAW